MYPRTAAENETYLNVGHYSIAFPKALHITIHGFNKSSSMFMGSQNRIIEIVIQ
jgi:hypothetical protein